MFPQAAGGERDVQLDCVDDTTRIHDLFRPYVDPEGEGDLEDPFLPYRLATGGGVSHLMILMEPNQLTNWKFGFMRSLKLGNVWVCVQLIRRPRRTENKLFKNSNIP